MIQTVFHEAGLHQLNIELTGWSMAGSTSFFDRWSLSYDRERLQQSTYTPIHDEVLRRLAQTGPGRILDLGCGTGHLTKRMIDAFPASGVVGADLSPGMLTKAADRLSADRTGGAVLVRSDAQRLPFTAGSFDVITCTESFHWYTDQAATMETLGELLVPGGRLLLASIATVTGIGEDVLRFVSQLGGTPIRALTADNMRAIVEKAGLAVVDQRRIRRAGFLPPPIFTEAVRRN